MEGGPTVLADQITEKVPVRTMPINMAQGYHAAALSPVVRAAELMFYRACVTDFDANKLARQEWWRQSDDPLASLYRQVCAMKLPVLKRSVVQGADKQAVGACFGLTVGGSYNLTLRTIATNRWRL